MTDFSERERAVAIAICRSENGGSCGCEAAVNVCRVSIRSSRAAISAYESSSALPQGSAPEGMVLVPNALTAENGAKYALMGEFFESVEVRGRVQKVPVSWTTIKEIHQRVVALFATPSDPVVKVRVIGKTEG